MIIIKIKMKVVTLALLIAILMYPRTMGFIANNIENIYIAVKLNLSTIQYKRVAVDTDKTKIVLMFDDGWKSVYTEAYEVMSEHDYRGCIQVIPSLIVEDEYMSYEQLAELYIDGWDLLNHSYSHKEGMYDKCDELLSDINQARQWMNNRYIGTHSDMVVIPYGEINPYLIGQLKEAGYRNVRTSDNIIKLDENKIEYYPITTINLLTNVTVNEVEEILSQTIDKSKTVILILHKIDDEDDGFGMTYKKEKFEQILTFINKHSDDFQVITYSQLF